MSLPQSFESQSFGAPRFVASSMQVASSSWRKSTAITLVALLHLAMFYAFTHGMTVPKLLELATPIKLVPVPVEITPPPPPIVPASLQEPRSKFDQPVPIVADQPVFETESAPNVIAVDPHANPADQSEGGAGPVVDDAVHSLVATHRVEPAYPAAARRAGEQGTVLLSVRIDPSGAVSAVTIVRSSGSMRLDDAAREAVKRWRFAARQGGAGSTVEVKLPISFKLESTRF